MRDQPNLCSAFNFLVQIVDPEYENLPLGDFTEVSDLCTAAHAVDCRRGNNVAAGARKNPGLHKSAAIRFSRGVVDPRAGLRHQALIG